MGKKRRYFLFALTIIIIVAGVVAISRMPDETITQVQLPQDSRVFSKINGHVDESIKENGVYLLNTDEKNVVYLVLDSSHLNSSNEIPHYSDLKIEKNESTLTIRLLEELKTYSEKEDTELRAIYKIQKTNSTEYIDLYRNGARSAFDSIIVSGS